MEVLIVLIFILIIAIKEQIDIHTYIHNHKKETKEEVQQFKEQMQKLKDILH